jgi:hypothetical protein
MLCILQVGNTSVEVFRNVVVLHSEEDESQEEKGNVVENDIS